MRKTVKDRWVKALRSGRYDQGRACLSLRDAFGDDSFCCLGVLAHIVDPEGNTWKPRDISYGVLGDGESCKLIGGGLPSSIMDRLIMHNDGALGLKRKSFAWIASYIERYV